MFNIILNSITYGPSRSKDHCLTNFLGISSCIPISSHRAKSNSIKKGTKFAPVALPCLLIMSNLLACRGPFMNKDQVQAQAQGQDKGVSLETMIAVGVFGWLALGVVMMGLGIW